MAHLCMTQPPDDRSPVVCILIALISVHSGFRCNDTVHLRVQGDVSQFDEYEEQPVKWHGTGPDAFGDTFLGF